LSLLFYALNKLKKARPVLSFWLVLRFDHYFVVGRDGRSGGLSMFWNNDLSIDIWAIRNITLKNFGFGSW
jgi:hypothetical protein